MTFFTFFTPVFLVMTMTCYLHECGAIEKSNLGDKFEDSIS